MLREQQRELWRRAAATLPIRSNAAPEDGPIVLGPHTGVVWRARSNLRKQQRELWVRAAATRFMRSSAALDDSIAPGTQPDTPTLPVLAELSMWRRAQLARARANLGAVVNEMSPPPLPTTIPFVAGTLLPPYVTVYIWRRIS